MLQIITDTRAWALDSKYFSLVKGTILQMMQEGTLTSENFTSQKKADLPLPSVQIVSAAGEISAATPFAAFSAAGSEANPSGGTAVALIPIRGAMTKYGGSCSYGTRDIRGWLAEAIADPNVGSIVLIVDSPGGAVDGTEDLAREIKNSTKPVVAFVDGMAASAAYWVASQCSHIVINTATTAWVGSIGTLIAHVDQSGFLEKQGLKVTYITADASTDKVKGNSTVPLDEEAISMFKADLNSINDTFLATVKEGRGDRIADQKKWDSARIMNGREGKANGLVDQIGTLNDAISKAAKLAQVKPGSTSSKSKSTHNSNMKFTSLLFSAAFPSLAAKLGISAATENVEITEESLKTAEAAIAAADLAKATAEASLATAQTTIKSLTEEKQGLSAQVTTLEAWKKKAEGKTPPAEDNLNDDGKKKPVASYNAHAQSVQERVKGRKA